MIVGCGVDIADNRRFSPMNLSLLKHIFTERELEEASKINEGRRAEFFSSRFAAKEALSKALGTGFKNGFTPHSAEVRVDDLGRPYFLLSPSLEEKLKDTSVFLSLSHEKEYSVAMVVLDGKK